MTRVHAFVLASLLGVSLAGPLYAQDPDDPASSGRFHFGPVRFSPALTFVGPGVDTNVFNEVDNPKKDTTAKVAPSADWWLRTGPGLFTASTEVDYQHYFTYSSQRSWNTHDSGKFALRLGRVQPFVFGSYVNTRERPNYEISVRARYVESALGIGTELRLLSRTTLVASANRTTLRYDENDQIFGESLAYALDRKTDLVRLDVRHRLTSLTTFIVRAESQQDRFDQSHFRDADSVRVTPGFEFKPFALVSGSAYIGYRSFRPLEPAVPDYRGLVASVDLAYALSSTRFTGRFSRDVVYSYELREPYYLLNDVTFSVTQMITAAFDFGATFGHQGMDYQQLAPVVISGHKDNGFHAGATAGYWLGRTFRVGFDVDYYQRRSNLYAYRNYRSLVAGVSVKYGLKP